MKTQLLSATDAALETAVKLLKNNELTALPTETVYGLAANAHQVQAVQKVFWAKDRPEHDPLIVHVSKKHLEHPAGILASMAMEGTISIDTVTWACKEKLELLLRRYWPGPLTLLLPRGTKIPDLVTNGSLWVGVRCPDHPVFQDVLKRLAFPLAAPSANRFGRISPTRAQHVWDELNGKIPLIIDGGPCQVGVESTILKVEDEPYQATLLRPGKLGTEEIEKILQVSVSTLPSTSKPKPTPTLEAPGQLDEHYAPQKPLWLVAKPFYRAVPSMIQLPAFDHSKMGVLSMSPLSESYLSAWNPQKWIELSHQNPTHEPLQAEQWQQMAQRLFHSLRELDQDPHVQWIICDVPEGESGLVQAIRDRLKRASTNKPSM